MDYRDLSIRFCDERLSNLVSALRCQEYQKAKGFKTKLESLNWKSADNESYVMVVEQNSFTKNAARGESNLVATMRGEVLRDQKLLESKIECPWIHSELGGQTILLLTRAATDQMWQGHGFNLLMRYWFLKMAMTQNISYLVGSFVEDSPRSRTLKKMGYDYYENKLGWQSENYKSERKVILAVLDLKSNGASAIDYCQSNLPTELLDIPFSGSSQLVKEITCL